MTSLLLRLAYRIRERSVRRANAAYLQEVCR